MTDAELLDGLQKLFDANTVVLRSSRGGCKIQLAQGDMIYAEPLNPDHNNINYREYHSSDMTNPGVVEDIRVVIEKAIQGEVTV